MRKSPPYIGLIDFTTRQQAVAMAAALNKEQLKHPLRNPKVLHIGQMMSAKTLNNLETEWAKIWLPKEKIADVFIPGQTLNTLHFADGTSTDVLRNLIKAVQFCGSELNAIQLDMTWPEVDDIKIFRMAYPATNIILQVNDKAFKQIDENVHDLLKKLDEYETSIDYVLLDKSAGKGIGLDADYLRPFVDALYKHKPDLRVAVAGGLGPETLHLVEPLIKDYPSLSIDAQSRLRPSHNCKDPVDWTMAEDYIVKAVKMFAKYAE